MGTRTAPRKKTKQIQRKKQQAARPLSRKKHEKRVESATFGEGAASLNSVEFSPGSAPVGSPIETAQAWAEENEACSTIKQVAAAALICGQKVSKTASALGVDRRTIQRWQKLDPEFHLAMVQTKQEVILSSRQYLLALAEEAVEVVETKLDDEQNAQVALNLLRGIGVLSPQLTENGLLKDAQSEAELAESKQADDEFRAQSDALKELVLRCLIRCSEVTAHQNLRRHQPCSILPLISTPSN